MANSDVILVVLVALVAVYTLVAAFATLRTCKLHKFSPEWQFSKWFYVSVLIQPSLRAIFFIVIIAGLDDLGPIVLYLLLSIPDSIYMTSYLLLFWQMLSVFYHSHIASGIHATFLQEFTKVQMKRGKTGIFMICFITAQITIQGLMYICFIAGSFQDEDISFEISIVNILLASFGLGSMFFLYFKYSGIPTKSDAWKQKLRKVCFVTGIWTATRYVRGALFLAGLFSLANVTDHIGDGGDLIEACLFIVILIGCEVICFLLVLDYGFIWMFMFTDDDTDSSRASNVSLAYVINDEEEAVLKRDSSEITPAVIPADPYIEETQLIIIEELPARRKNGLGRLYKAKLGERDVIYRKIELTRISNYVMAEFTQEVEQLQELQATHLIPVHGVVLNLPIVGIVTSYISNGSLYETLHVRQTKFSVADKVRIACNIASSLEKLHAQSMVHGHLTSHNILVDDDYRIYITDLGFFKIKKYASIVMGYTNKSAWSSPELLKEKRLTAAKVNKSDDV